jgi:hypothetical protein
MSLQPLCRTTAIFGAAIVALACAATARADLYTTGFEDFTVGPMSASDTGPTQGGWSGGAVGGFVNSDAGDEQIVNTVSHTGAQSWHYARGYNSPGSGTAYTPNLSLSVSNVGDSMTGSVWFKAHTAADNSLLAIETGNIAGDDRAEILAYIDNVGGGLTIRSFTTPGFAAQPIASGLDASVWHELSFSLTRTATDNAVTISVDGGAPVAFAGSLKEFRDNLPAPYSESSRLKFRPRHADGNLSFNGFYLDDITYEITAAAVPEASSFLAVGVIGLLLGVGKSLRKKSA